MMNLPDDPTPGAEPEPEFIDTTPTGGDGGASPEPLEEGDDPFDAAKFMEGEPGFEGEGGEGEGEGEGDQLPDDGLVEVEVGGVKYRVPKDLQDAYAQQQAAPPVDRFQVQATPEETQADNAIRERMEQAREVSNRYQGIVARLAEFEKVPWAELRAQDPDRHDDLWRQQMQLTQMRDSHKDWLDKARADINAHGRDVANRRLRATREFAAKNLKGWTPQLDADITQLAQREFGFSESQISEALSPQIYNVLYHAYIGYRTLNKPATIKRDPSPKPSTAVRGKAPAPSASPSDNDSIDKWMDKRRAEVAKAG